jgi:hypothetical protein
MLHLEESLDGRIIKLNSYANGTVLLTSMWVCSKINLGDDDPLLLFVARWRTTSPSFLIKGIV